jgi:hypothetical protein
VTLIKWHTDRKKMTFYEIVKLNHREH